MGGLAFSQILSLSAQRVDVSTQDQFANMTRSLSVPCTSSLGRALTYILEEEE